MPRPEGLPKTGGRRKGTPNKSSLGFVEELDRLGVNVLEQIVSALPRLAVEKQVDVLMNLLPYVYSKRKPFEQEKEFSIGEF